MIAAPARQHGVAALAVTMLLFFVMVLGSRFVNRNLVFEQRASANQYRSTQAFEAAEAGLEWTLAQLGRQPAHRRRLPADRGRHGDVVPVAAARVRRSELRPSPRRHGSMAAPCRRCRRPASARRAGWRCSCPAGGRAHPRRLPMRRRCVQRVLRSDRTARLVLRRQRAGCSSFGGQCAAGSASPTDASARIRAAAAPAHRTGSAADGAWRRRCRAAPRSAHTTRDTGVGRPRDPRGRRDSCRAWPVSSGPAGGTSPSTQAAHDTALSALTAGQFFASYFGLDKTAWARQPLVRHPRPAAAIARRRCWPLIADDPRAFARVRRRRPAAGRAGGPRFIGASGRHRRRRGGPAPRRRRRSRRALRQRHDLERRRLRTPASAGR